VNVIKRRAIKGDILGSPVFKSYCRGCKFLDPWWGKLRSCTCHLVWPKKKGSHKNHTAYLGGGKEMTFPAIDFLSNREINKKLSW